MAYTLDQFCAESRAILKAQALADALPQIAERLGRLLANPAFVADSFSDDMPPGRRELHHDPETDFYVLAHVQEGNKVGKPHSHGASWAVYGNARAVTEMTEWRRTNPEGEDHAELDGGEQISAHARPDQGLWPGRDPLDRASGEGLGDPRHRHRPRRAAALSFRQAGQDFGEGVRATVRRLRRARLAPSPLEGEGCSLVRDDF